MTEVTEDIMQYTYMITCVLVASLILTDLKEGQHVDIHEPEAIEEVQSSLLLFCSQLGAFTGSYQYAP
jgi:hypothetical protein